MAIPFRKNLPALLLLLAILTQFTPQLSDFQRSLASSGLYFAAVQIYLVISPPDLGEKPPRIIWDERDSGEQFSIVMFHLLLLSISFFIAYQIASNANAPDGSKWMNILAAMVIVSGLWFVWSNWKNRNAR